MTVEEAANIIDRLQPYTTDFNTWELSFFENVSDRTELKRTLTENQANKLRSMERTYLG